MDASTTRIRSVMIRMGYFGLVASLLLALAVGRTSGTWSANLRQRLVIIAICLLVLPVVAVLYGAIWRGPAEGKRRQITLRTLFVEVTLFVATGAYLANLCFAVAEDGLVEREIQRISGKTWSLTIDSNDRTPAAAVRALPHAKNLQILKIHDQPINSLQLKNIGQLRQLRSLEITGCNLPDDDLVHLAGLPYLHSLSLANTNISDGGLKHLAKLKQLKRLTLSGTKVTGVGFTDLAKTQLSIFDIGNTPITSAGLRNIDLLKNLSWLHLENIQLDAIPGLQPLGGLSIRNSILSVNAFREIGESKELRSLDLSGTNLTDDELPLIVALPELRSLDLSGTMITDAGFAGLEPIKNLQRVSFARTSVGDAAATYLSQCPKVHAANLRNTVTGDPGARSLGKLKDNLAFGSSVEDPTETVYVDLHKTNVSKQAIQSLEETIGKFNPDLNEGGVNTGPQAHWDF